MLRLKRCLGKEGGGTVAMEGWVCHFLILAWGGSSYGVVRFGLMSRRGGARKGWAIQGCRHERYFLRAGVE
jgi:hypothetical protein